MGGSVTEYLLPVVFVIALVFQGPLLSRQTSLGEMFEAGTSWYLLVTEIVNVTSSKREGYPGENSTGSLVIITSAAAGVITMSFILMSSRALFSTPEGWRIL